MTRRRWTCKVGPYNERAEVTREDYTIYLQTENGTATSWIVLTPSRARKLAAKLLQAADETSDPSLVRTP